MAAEWYYSKDGQQHGPVSASVLKNLAKTGNLLPTDLIWKEGMAEWKPASNIKGLFSAMPVSAAESPKASPASPQVGRDEFPMSIGFSTARDPRLCKLVLSQMERTHHL